MFFAVFTQKQPDIPLRVYETFDAASSVLTKLKNAGKSAWVTELDLHLLSHYTNTIDTELREIFDYARFEKFWPNTHHRLNSILGPTERSSESL